ncbi:MAG TPA: hypothetical protein EYP41_04255 [Anaerolineae bacterium]|nr:hypothetical protein [Anaerolineae bacterium]
MNEHLLRQILQLEKIEYAIVNQQGYVTHCSPYFNRWLLPNHQEIVGHHLTDLFDEFVGLEEPLQQILQGHPTPLKIEKIHRQENDADVYMTLTAVSTDEGLLLLITDVTAEGILEQKITQHRNELALLSTQLEVARSQLHTLLHRFLPTAVARRLAANPQNVKLGGERRFVTILFADLRGFTRWTEGVEPEIALHILNDKLATAVTAITDAGGIVDKYMGDAVMGVFNAPENDKDHALHAVRAAWQITQGLKNNPTLYYSVGINTGTAVAGNIGTVDVMNYTVIGDAVNQAKRLQEIARPGQILISQSTYNLTRKHVYAFPLGGFQLRGRQQETHIFHVTEVVN